MERRFERNLEDLKTALAKMGSVAEESLGVALKALLSGDQVLAQRVFEMEEKINRLEIEIDTAIIDLLALNQPVAGDLRFIIATQKINNDLERIGDHAVNIAESVLTLQTLPGVSIPPEIHQMVEIARTMLKQALDSFILLDTSLARTVLRTDDQIDDLNRLMAQQVITQVKNNVLTIEGGLELIRISRNLERIADLSTNIAEDVIFETEARVVKHHAERNDTN
ncbi:MAG: phosphate signaling complex protein PhoU [Ignavibacteriales bacterium]|nr:phosphate signaling complex protein PhoU [Ignavibacteriales bacterium]